MVEKIGETLLSINTHKVKWIMKRTLLYVIFLVKVFVFILADIDTCILPLFRYY